MRKKNGKCNIYIKEKNVKSEENLMKIYVIK